MLIISKPSTERTSWVQVFIIIITEVFIKHIQFKEPVKYVRHCKKTLKWKIHWNTYIEMEIQRSIKSEEHNKNMILDKLHSNHSFGNKLWLTTADLPIFMHYTDYQSKMHQKSSFSSP